MARASLRFYADLNDFLRPRLRGRVVEHDFHGSPAVRDVVEGLGPPHTEVGLILVDGQPSPDSRRLHGGERVSVYPVWRTLTLKSAGSAAVRGSERFILDVHLGRLARLLRLLGLDCLYANDADDATIARLAAQQDRIVLSRDRGVLKRRLVERGCCIRSQAPGEQAVEVLRRFALWELCRPFTRCLACNGTLHAARAEAVAGRVPERLRREATQFSVCDGCGRAYWPGSHYRRLQAVASSLLSRAGPRG